jgi:hypothetical protein
LRNLKSLLFSYCACTVKLALCVSLLSDTTPEISNLQSETHEVISDNSHYSIFKEPKLLSTKCRNFNSQRIENSTYDLVFNQHSTIANQQFVGGGEGIRTPDPRVANAVLCQLSYTPDKHCQFSISDCQLINLRGVSAIGNRQLFKIGCGGGI